MQRNKRNILNTAIAAIIISMMNFFAAIASVFCISQYFVILLILKIKRAGRNKISAHQLN